MKTNLNLYNGNNTSFCAIRLEKTPELVKTMKRMPAEKRQIFQDTFTILETALKRKPEEGKYTLDVMPPIKANYIRTGTFNIRIFDDKNKFRTEFHPVYSMEDLSLKINDEKTTAGFYMNTKESPQNLAKWLLEAFDNLKNNITKKS